jgi:hypothetical protein
MVESGLAVVGGVTGMVDVKPPRPLGEHGMALWRAIRAEYDISDVGGVEILCQACQAADRVEALAALISRDGEVILTPRGASVSHPGLKDEVHLRAFIVRSIERLGLNFEAVRPSGGRPPNLRGA